ncbi:MAG: ATP-binding protein [Ignavibacteriaceae bacterium]
MKKIILPLICSLFFISASLSQNKKENGYPLITNYTAKEYGAFQGNWAIAQDKRGVMYFGNDIGLLEYDGSSWRFYQVPNKTTLRSVAPGSDGKLYAGAVGDLGYFSPDSSGSLSFYSLMKFLPADKKDFSDVWQTFILNNKVYFDVMKYLLVWDIEKKQFKIIKGSSNFHLTFKVNGNVYLREWGRGLEVLKNDSLILLKGGEKFANERIYVMLPFPGEPGTILIVTRTMGLIKYDGKNFIPFKTEVDNFIKENLIYSPGRILSDGNILLGTIRGGAVVIDTAGNLVKKYNRKSGIISDGILYTYQDRAGAIWLGTDNGISRIDYSSPLSYFDSRNNLSSAPLDITRYKDIIYVAANNGVYYLDPITLNLQLLKNSGNQSFAFLKIDNELLVGTFDGLFKVDGNKLTAIRKTVGNEYNIQALSQSKLNPERVFVGAQGLWSVLRRNNHWIDEGRILNVTDVASSIIEDDDGTLWVGTNASGVFKISFPKSKNGDIIVSEPHIKHFDKNNGLQSGFMYINKFNGKKYFTTADSTYRFDESRKRFYSDTSDNIVSSFYKLADNKGVSFFQQDSMGHLWLGTRSTIAMGSRQSDGSYKWLISPFNRFAGEQIGRVYAEKNGITWFLSGSGVIRYDFSKSNLNNTIYPAIVRRVDIGKDSTIYSGDMLNSPVVPEIPFKYNSIKFNFSASSYEGKNSNNFKSFLVGFDDDWSVWSKENTKEYTNLPPGKYTFKVAAQNILGIESSIGAYSFRILPPWYRTWWAYTGYFIMFGGLVFGIDRAQRRRLLLKEKQRSRLRESELRAETAEAETKALQAENERNKNIELLSEIGKEITATLDLDKIFLKLYEHVNQLADATIFGLGIYNPEKEEIEYKLSMEKGKRYPPYSRDIKDKNQFAVWCIDNRKPVFINDVHSEYSNYILHYNKPHRKLEDGTMSEEAWSIIYLPLISQERMLGIITIQSFQKNAYQDYHLNLLQNLASYTAIALDNADAYKKLNETVNKLNTALNDLKATQEKLVVQEKLASLGQLTAGIAHEIKNPLNFVNNFAQLSKELVVELRDEFEKVKDKLGNEFADNFEDIISNIEQNAAKINEHGNRADSIVRSMLQHSRGKSGERILSDINAILDEDLNLAYHGLRARDSSFNASIEKEYDKNLEKISIVPQDVSRVFLNIINNGFYEANKKKKLTGDHFSPCVKVTTRGLDNKIEVRIKDNGSGIPEGVREKIFDPFFTTKPSGEGTGLGLSLSYDIIVKEHAGDIKFDTKSGEYTEFVITLPNNLNLVIEK